MEYLVDGKLPDDLSFGLVFSNSELARLQNRIKELINEKSALKRQQKELRVTKGKVVSDMKGQAQLQKQASSHMSAVKEIQEKTGIMSAQELVGAPRLLALTPKAERPRVAQLRPQG